MSSLQQPERTPTKITRSSFLKRAVGQVIGIPLGVVASIVPKKPQLIAFGAWEGKLYADNPRYLAQEALDLPGCEAVWISRTSQSRDSARRDGLEAYTIWNPRGWWAAARSATWVYTHNAADIAPGPFFRSRKVNLTHGTPLKRIQEVAGATPSRLRSLRQLWLRLLPADDVICVASPEAQRRFARTNPDTTITATGYPRWLPMLRSSRPEQTHGLTVLYAPTQRGYGNRPLDFVALPGFDEFTAWAARNGHRLLFRGHFSQRQLSDPGADSPWEPADSSVVIDVNDLLPDVDVLITDYSSIFYDFAVAKDRMIFLAPDVETFQSQDSGLLVPYDTEVPGNVVVDWLGVLAWMEAGCPPSPRLPEFRRQHAGLADGGIVRRCFEAMGLGHLVQNDDAHPPAEADANRD